MKQFNGYDEAKKAASVAGSAKLPAGAYVARIMNVRYTDGTDGNSDRIDIQFDIDEGDQKDFFKHQYEANTADDKKWKGKTSIYVPDDDGSERDSWTKKTFAGWTDSLERSNTGYIWDWDEKKWKNKIIGLVFGETGNVIDGHEVTYTEVRFPIGVDKVRNGSAPVAKFKARNGYTGTAQNESAPSVDNAFLPDTTEEEIPF